MSSGGDAPPLGSLRGAYSSTAAEWTFIEAPGSSSSASSSSAAGASSSSAGAWSSSSAPPRARVLDLSPYPIEDLDAGAADVDLRTAFKWLISAGVLQYATTGIAMPFEVAKILMMCQWIPKDATEGELPSSRKRNGSDSNEDEDEKDDSVSTPHLPRTVSYFLNLYFRCHWLIQMSDASAESYFHDPAREAFSAATRYDAESSTRKLHPTDGDGYIMRESINDDFARPEYVLPVGPTDGVWAMIKRIREFKPEGWTALWKCQCHCSFSSQCF